MEKGKKRYQLVAWTRNLKDQKEPEIRMIPSLHHEMQEPYFKEIARCRQEEKEGSGIADEELASRFVRVFEQNARFLFSTGHYGDGLRFLRKAAFFCIESDTEAWTCWDTDLGSYMYFVGKLRGEFFRLMKEFVFLAKKYRREDILTEEVSRNLLSIYREQTREDRDLERHLRDMKAWK